MLELFWDLLCHAFACFQFYSQKFIFASIILLSVHSVSSLKKSCAGGMPGYVLSFFLLLSCMSVCPRSSRTAYRQNSDAFSHASCLTSLKRVVLSILHAVRIEYKFIEECLACHACKAVFARPCMSSALCAGCHACKAGRICKTFPCRSYQMIVDML